MLGKLIKYDLKEIFKVCVPLYIVGFAIASVNGIILLPMLQNAQYGQDLLTIIIAMFVNVSMFFIFAIAFIAVVLCIIRFYKNVFGKEGYLTNTLPVSPNQILMSNIISSAIVSFVSIIVVFILVLVFAFGQIGYSFEAFDFSIFREIPISVILSVITLSIVGFLSSMLLAYMSIALGHLSKHRAIMSFVWYFGINYLVLQPITTIIMFVTIMSSNIMQHHQRLCILQLQI